MTQQVSHSLYGVHSLCNPGPTIFYGVSGSPTVSVCVESQLSYLLPAEYLSRVVSQTLLLSSVEFLSREWSVESDSVEKGEQHVIVQRSAREQTRQSLCIWYSTQM